MKRGQLSSEDRSFLETVSQIILSNPFSDERQNLEKTLVPGMGQNRLARMAKFHGLLHERVGQLKRTSGDNINQFEGDDKRLVSNAFLYDVYARFEPKFDDVIQQQLNTPDKLVPVSFAQELLRTIRAYGFTSETGLGYIALFFQLRRAFYFIEQSLVGDSPSMKQLRRSLWNNVFTSDLQNYNAHLWNKMEDFSTLLLGETGTGKGSAAAAIGRSGFIPFNRRTDCFSENFTEIFVATNLSRFPENLIESELFGHRRGAFTGAIDNHKGLFEYCSIHGSLFLDEIGDLSVPVQLKLLQVLQERFFTPVGSHESKRFSGRVIAATNHSMLELREQKLFRDDFFYRLCSDVITVPPLRERIEESPNELELLVDLLVTRLIGEKKPELTDFVLETLKIHLPDKYPWPGNVRELEQAVRRVLLNGSYTGETPRTRTQANSIIEGIHGGTLSVKQMISRYCSMLYTQHGTYEEVARRTGLDRRTVKKYLDSE